MTKKIGITFFLKEDKIKIDGTAPVYVRLTGMTGKTSFTTRVYIFPERWHSTKQLKLVRKQEDQLLKSELEKIRKEILDITHLISKKSIVVSVEQVKNQWLNSETIDSNENRTLLELFDAHNEKFWERVEVGKREKESFKKYKAVQFHIKEFIQSKFNVLDLPLFNLNQEFLEAYEIYLRKKGIGNNTAMKYCQFFSAMVKTGIKKGWFKSHPFVGFDYEFEEVETRYLTESQIDSVFSKKFKSERLSIVRDIFLFSCLTSYAPVDVRALTYSKIREVDGKKWIYTKRKKTGIDSNVPILPQAQYIIDKYKDHPDRKGNMLLPLRSNPKMNEYLKEVGDLCNIDFDLTYYHSRHTFGTLMITLGVTMEAVSKMMGHRRLTQTQHYAKIVENKVGKEMAKAETLLGLPLPYDLCDIKNVPLQ